MASDALPAEPEPSSAGPSTSNPLPPEFLERVELPSFGDATPVSELIEVIRGCDQHQSRLAWESYTRIAHLHALTIDRPPELDTRVFDHFANSSVLLGTVNHIDKSSADTLLNEALALVHRIPEIGRCLHDGTINQQQFKQLVSITDLVEGWPSAPNVDTSIAHELRENGVCSSRRLRDLANRIIFEHDPDAVRRRAERARARRSAATRPRPDGMAHFGITATAEDAQLAMAAVEALISTAICPLDPRSKNARRSDAAMSKLQGLPLVCQCEDDDCTAAPADDGLSDQHARIIVHVICQDDTLRADPEDGPESDLDPTSDNPEPGLGPELDDTPGFEDDPGPVDGTDDGPNSDDSTSAVDDTDSRDSGDGQGSGDGTRAAGGDSGSRVGRSPSPPRRTSDRPGFLDGYGVITADHVRDIVKRPDVVIRPLNPRPGQELPTHQPGDPYRFSAALDAFIRARDGYCVQPGCNRPAWACDLDHVDEFDHQHPSLGGQTDSINGNAKCRHHHLFKTFGNWLDDQFIDADGRTHVTVTSPNGITVDMHGHTNEILFPALRTLRFQKPAPRGPTSSPDRDSLDPASKGPQRARTRTAEKHARRRREREINRRFRALHDPTIEFD